MRRLSALLFFPLVIACNKEIADPPPPATNRVIAGTNLQFSPNDVPIRVGGTVTWEFLGTAHTVIFQTKPGAPNNIAVAVQNSTEGRVFTTAGIFEYDCDIHNGMSGTVRVIAP